MEPKRITWLALAQHIFPETADGLIGIDQHSSHWSLTCHGARKPLLKPPGCLKGKQLKSLAAPFVYFWNTAVSAFCPLKGIYAVWEEILSAVLFLTCFSPTPFNPTRMTSIHGVRHTKAKAREDCWLSRNNFDSGQ